MSSLRLRAFLLLLQGWHFLRFIGMGLRGLKGLPLLGSLRMMSLGFLPDRQKVYRLGPWPARSRARLYFSDLQRERMWVMSAGRLRYRELLTDKAAFTGLVSGFTSAPKLLAVVEFGRVFPLSGDLPSPDAKGLAAAARAGDGLVLKPRVGGGGCGVFFFQTEADRLLLDNEPVLPADLEARIRGLTSYIVTPRVRQARYAESFYPRTTNTLRVLTMVDPKTGEPFAAMAAQRIGTDASFPVDNYGQGGLYSVVDLATGRLAAAVRKDGTRHATHPDTGVQVEGAVVPRWPELLQAIIRLARQLRFIDYVGWDFVATDEGLSVIEGNYNPNFLPAPLLADERVRSFYQYHLSLRPKKLRLDIGKR